MTNSLPSVLPAFDQAQLDKRFLAELARLLEAGAFPTYQTWAGVAGVQLTHLAGITGGKYHCNLKLLYATLRAFPAFDYQYVLFGSAVFARPEPAAVPARRRGPQAGTVYRARVKKTAS